VSEIDLSQFPQEVRLWLAEVDLGDEAERFMESKVGRYIVGRAQQVAQQAYEQLRDTDPADTAAIRRLQDTIRWGESIGGWIEELILGGKNAQEQIQNFEAHQGD